MIYNQTTSKLPPRSDKKRILLWWISWGNEDDTVAGDVAINDHSDEVWVVALRKRA